MTLTISDNLLILDGRIIDNRSKRSSFTTDIASDPADDLSLDEIYFFDQRFRGTVTFEGETITSILLYWLDGHYMQNPNWDSIVHEKLEQEHERTKNWLTEKIGAFSRQINDYNVSWDYEWGKVIQMLDIRSSAVRTAIVFSREA